MYFHQSLLAALAASFALATPLPALVPDSAVSVVERGVLQTRATVGTASVLNSCSFPIYLVSVGDTSGPTVTLNKGNFYSETYRTTASGSGISIKIAKNTPVTSSQPITQLEYIISGSTLFYDVSLINGNAFTSNGFSLKASVASCPSFTCPANAANCNSAYTTWEDEGTKSCAESANLKLTFCG